MELALWRKISAKAKLKLLLCESRNRDAGIVQTIAEPRYFYGNLRGKPIIRVLARFLD
jgi:hypothetical protein